MKINNRLNNVPYFPIDEVNELIKKKNDIINLAIGDSDITVNENIIKGIKESIGSKNFNRYTFTNGIDELKEEIINYYKESFDVNLELDEVAILNGVANGISSIIPAVCDIGNYVIISKPSHPMYESISKLWGTISYKITLKENNDYLPQMETIPEEIIRKSKLFIINYPNNPTGAIGNEEFYKNIIKFCYNRNIVLCNDGSYIEIIRNEHKPLSLLQFDKKKTSIELGSFSPIYSMSGFRIAYVVGNRDVINALKSVRNYTDFSTFIPIQMAAINALCLGKEHINNIKEIYNNRMVMAEKILSKFNIDFYKSQGTFYIWCKIPKNYTTDEFYNEALNKSNVLIMPGYIFGNLSYGYFRIALTTPDDKIKQGLNNLGKLI